MSPMIAPSRPDAPRSRPYLDEIQGLRTVAALMVAVYHIWFSRVSGGVDVFFVVASYFMILSLTREGGLPFRAVFAYHVATLRRVMPMATTVIVATILIGYFVVPQVMWSSEIRHAAASIAQVENWRLAVSNTDYLDEGLTASLFQQMWALSVQMQFYLLFPLLAWAAVRIGTRSGVAPARALVAAFAAVFAVSFSYSLYMTAENQAWAYFDTGARAWEFAAGAILALTAHRIVVSPATARVLGIAGLAVIVLLGLAMDVSRQFPGYAALVPVLGVAAVMIAARNGGRVPVLTWKPVMRAGDISFAFYLWHWPLLIALRYVNGGEVGLLGGAAVIVVAGLLAYAGTALLETPFRRSPRLVTRPALSLVLSGALMVPAVAATGAWAAVFFSEKREATAEARAFMVASDGYATPDGDLVPHPVIVRSDLPVAYDDGCHQEKDDPTLKECVYGRPDGSITIVLAGGSHSTQWLPALQKIAERRDLRIVTALKSACLLGAPGTGTYSDPSCELWNERAQARIIEIRPDLLITIGTRVETDLEIMVPEVVEAIGRLGAAGIPVLALRDNPRFEEDAPLCVELNADDMGRCASPRSEMYLDPPPYLGLDLPNVRFVDFSDDFCPGDACPVAEDGLLRYRDQHHLTIAYVLTFVDRLEQAIDAALRASGRTPLAAADG